MHERNAAVSRGI